MAQFKLHLVFTCILLFFIPLLPILDSGRCREDQQSLLLQLKHGLNFNHSLSRKLVAWNSSIDCCEWPGISCDPGGLGRVVGLDLSWESITRLEDATTLFNLTYLEELDLSFNEFNTTIPTQLANLANLRYLDLSFAGFNGRIHADAISHLSNLISLNLSCGFGDPKLEIPHLALLVRNLTQLTHLRLDYIDLSIQGNEWFHVISSSLPNLKTLSLFNCSLSSPIHPTISKLQHLSILRLSYNNFSSPVPEFFRDFENLIILGMGSCNLIGTFPMKIVETLTRLAILDFSNNQLVGNIQAQWESLPNLFSLSLDGNFLDGSIPPSLFSIPSLQAIALSNNQLEGPVPRSVFELPSLYHLDLSSNRLSGRVELSWFQTLKHLSYLDLSYNNLTVYASMIDSSTSPDFPYLDTLNLVSCNMRTFPQLGSLPMLSGLDLSDNDINGVVPRWIMESTTLQRLNLSHNNLVDFEVRRFSSSFLRFLDMHNNQLQGEFPFIPSSSQSPTPSPSTPPTTFIDFSHNHFNGSIPIDGMYKNPDLAFLSLSNNSLTGSIPTSICDAVRLEVINLANNYLNGTIPSCLTKFMEDLRVMDLRGNRFSGNIPDTFQASCALQTLNLSSNELHGRLPKSLENCTKLEVLDIGNNRISDVFPCVQGIKSSLRVLILRNNLFHGSIGCSYDDRSTWRQLQIIDLASNNFSGPLNANYLDSWKAMMEDEKGAQDLIKFASSSSPGYYQDSITVSTNGLELELVKILTIFKSIDMSSNSFDGPIPENVGKFEALRILNLSHNAFTSEIPSVFGNLSSLEFLDLSHNKLTGHIPSELADLTFLSFLNLSNNQLTGGIPTGRQLQTFENTSFGGNPKLCGYPLTRSCTSPPAPPDDNNNHGKSSERIDWDKLSKAFGYIFGLGAIMLPAALWPSFRVWYWPKIDSMLLWIFPKLYVKDWNNRLTQRNSRRRIRQ